MSRDRDVSREEAAILLEPRFEAIRAALSRFWGPGAWELDAAADCVACIKMAVAIKLAVHKVEVSPEAEARIGERIDEAIAREVLALKGRPE
jgi:hypothetical protein